MVELIEALTARGLSVASIKHAHHDFDIDHENKDSWRHRKAGACEVVVVSGQRWAHIRELKAAPEPPLEALLGRLGAVDIVLVEGYKHGDHRKIEVWRAGSDAPLLAKTDPNVVAVVSDEQLAGIGQPVIAPNDLDTIVARVLEVAGLG
jgi:molybdopterin-guanine dinucleotide biosynthesis protein MobB